MVAVLEFSDVTVVRDRNRILDSLTWSVESDQRWVVLGPNGAGKTTLLQVASATIHPSSGTATLLGESLGASDVFEATPEEVQEFCGVPFVIFAQPSERGNIEIHL